MKAISPEMKAHISAGSTTLAACWRIQRPDRKVFAYTEHDADITYNNEVYKAHGGFNKTAIKSSGNLAVDNMEVTGYLTDDTIPESELRNGAFDYSEVEVFLVNYEDLSMGSIKLRYGFFGEVSTVPSGAFLVELRGLIDLLTMKVGDVYIPECRLDLGDQKCKIKLVPDQRENQQTYKVGDRVVVPLNAPMGFTPDFPLTGYSDEIDRMGFHPLITGRLQANLFLAPKVGDWYLEFEQTDSARMFDLLAESPLTAAMIDTGLYSLEAEIWLTGREYGAGGSMSIASYSTSNPFNKLDEATITKSIYLTRKWERFVLSIPLRPGARFIRWNANPVSQDSYSLLRLAADGFKVTVKQNLVDGSDFRMYGGVEFECTVAGTTSNIVPTFGTTLGDITVDGTVEWIAKVPKWMFLDSVAAIPTNSSTIVVTDLDNATEDFFEWGVLKFLTGKNAGFAIEILNYNNATKTIQTALPIPFKSEIGDVVQIQVGCDKRRRTCIQKFNNILEFRGHPDVPGQGQYFKVAGLE